MSTSRRRWNRRTFLQGILSAGALGAPGFEQVLSILTGGLSNVRAATSDVSLDTIFGSDDEPFDHDRYLKVDTFTRPLADFFDDPPTDNPLRESEDKTYQFLRLLLRGPLFRGYPSEGKPTDPQTALYDDEAALVKQGYYTLEGWFPGTEARSGCSMESQFASAGANHPIVLIEAGKFGCPTPSDPESGDFDARYFGRTLAN